MHVLVVTIRYNKNNYKTMSFNVFLLNSSHKLQVLSGAVVSM